MLFRIHFFPAFCLFALGLGLLVLLFRQSRRRDLGNVALFVGAAGLLCLGYALEFQRVDRHFPASWISWIQCAGLIETFCLAGLFAGLQLRRRAPELETGRRTFLRTAGASLCLAPVAATAFGILVRNRFQLVETEAPIANLPKDLDGLRIVQLTDIHLSPFLTEKELARAVDMANETRAHVALVTGDLITRPGDPLDACLKQLGRLRAEAGVLGCMGNHEIYTKTEDYVATEGLRLGIEFLRTQSRLLRFGGAAINFAGVDYQRLRSRYLAGAQRLIELGALNVLLSHNPDVFRVSAAQGYPLTIAGHTHGGQVDVEILHQHYNAARYFTPYVRGWYREGGSSIYVSTGLGTIGVPIRLGAPPEVTLLRLCAT